MNVLIVDDHVPWSNIAAAMFRGVADRVIMVETMREAKERIDRPNGFDVVLLDLTLPDSVPAQTIEQIPSIIATGRKVVVVTGQPVTDALRQAVQGFGARACLYKGSVTLAEELRSACA